MKCVICRNEISNDQLICICYLCQKIITRIEENVDEL